MSDYGRRLAQREAMLEAAILINVRTEESCFGPSRERRAFEADWQRYMRRDSDRDYGVIQGWPASGYGWPDDEYTTIMLGAILSGSFSSSPEARARRSAATRGKRHPADCNHCKSVRRAVA